VAQSNPSLVAAYLDSGSTSYTHSPGTNNATIASTAFVLANQSAVGGDTDVTYGNNGNGNYVGVKRKGDSKYWLLQWGKYTASAAGVYRNFPTAMSSTNPRVTATHHDSFPSETANGVNIRTVSGSGFTTHAQGVVMWQATGRQV
jgi:hypothetical protein